MASVTARVRCEIEVEVGKWSATASFESLTEQARKEGVHLVEMLLQKGREASSIKSRLVSQPTVAFILLDERG